MKKSLTLACLLVGGLIASQPVAAQTANMQSRAMWASVCNNSDVTTSGTPYSSHINKLLISWRALPGDAIDRGYFLYSRPADDVNATLSRANSQPVVNSTNLQLSSVPVTSRVYYLVDRDYFGDKGSSLFVQADDAKADLRANALDSLLVDERIWRDKLPYISIPLKSTEDVYDGDDLEYQANDVSVGDLDGDGEFEIVVKRLQSPKGHADGGIGASYSSKNTIYAVIWDAYKLDGTFMWRIKGGPGIFLGNSSCFAIADLDGDGCAEMAIRTSEGTVFGDGQEIGDVDGDGIIDYRTWDNLTTSHPGYMDHYMSKGPEFISIIDGKTGKEVARDNFINRDTSESWGDGYWKRANSLRVGIAQFDELPSVVLGRGVYARSVLEAWDYRNGELTRRWHFDSSKAGGRDTNKDGKLNSAYAGQGNHSFTVADLNGDGKDEIMYGSMAMDDDGYGLWSTGLGHGDAQHVGKFLPGREGLQVYHCLESGTTMVAVHDAKDGSVIWKKTAGSDNDTGRCMVADIDPNSPGCEFWWAGSNAYSQTGGTDLGYKPSSCNMGIWFDGTLSRQLINENIISNDRNGGRVFTMYRYSMRFINGSKSNPAWYGDMLGDWREEVIVPDQTMVGDLKIFSTWYPTEHRFPWLMTDHQYYMGVVNENIGYNQPPNLSYYIGTDLTSDQEAWEAGGYMPASIREVSDSGTRTADNYYYTMGGQRMTTRPAHGVYIHQGKKYVGR